MTEIAYSYARGGSSESGYVPAESPLGPTPQLPEEMGWSSPLRDQFDAEVRRSDGNAVRQQSSSNDADIQARQARGRVIPGQPVNNDQSGRVKQSERQATSAIDKGRREVSEEGGTLSEKYGATVRMEKISRNHGGNQAVWDTVGANSTRPEIGTPPKHSPVGEWHFGKDGAPVAGPQPNAAKSTGSSTAGEKPDR